SRRGHGTCARPGPRCSRQLLPAHVRPFGGGRMTAPPASSRWSRDMIENRLLAVLRPLVIVVLLIAAVFPFYYMVVLSFRPLDAVLQDPGALWVAPSELNWGTYASVLAPVTDGGQGFVVFIRNSFVVAMGTVLLALLVSI